MDSSNIIGTGDTPATACAAAQSPAAQGCSNNSMPSGSSAAAKAQPSSRSKPWLASMRRRQRPATVLWISRTLRASDRPVEAHLHLQRAKTVVQQPRYSTSSSKASLPLTRPSSGTRAGSRTCNQELACEHLHGRRQAGCGEWRRLDHGRGPVRCNDPPAGRESRPPDAASAPTRRRPSRRCSLSAASPRPTRSGRGRPAPRPAGYRILSPGRTPACRG